MKRTIIVLTALGCLAAPVPAQQVVSARAGLINYTEGAVTLHEEPVQLSSKQTYLEMKDGDVIRTARGRAEVLLSPGVLMRLAEDSAVRLESGSLTNTRVRVLGGDVIIEAAEIYEGGRLAIQLAGREALVARSGIYRFTADPAELRIYEGRIEVSTDDPNKPTLAKKNAVVSMTTGLIAGKFDSGLGDTFYRWTSRRSGYIAMANVSSAKMAQDNMYGYGFRGGWIYNPYFGMFTYIPYGGMLMSPFGYRYYTPASVYAVYAPPPSYNGGGLGGDGGFINRTPTYNPNYGYSTVGGRSASGAASAGIGASAPAASAAGGGGRSSGDGGGRGGSGSAGGRAQ